MTRIILPGTFAVNLGLPAVVDNALETAAFDAAARNGAVYGFEPLTEWKYIDLVDGETPDLIDVFNPAVHHAFWSPATAAPVTDSPPAISTTGKRGSRTNLSLATGYTGGDNPGMWLIHALKLTEAQDGVAVLAMLDDDDSAYGDGFVWNNGAATVEVRFGNISKKSFALTDPDEWHILEMTYSSATDVITARVDGAEVGSAAIGSTSQLSGGRLMVGGRGPQGSTEVSKGQHGRTWYGEGANISAADMTAIRAYFADTYGVTLAA